MTAVEVDRVVNGCGGISISGRQISVGMPLAGQRVRVRLDGVRTVEVEHSCVVEPRVAVESRVAERGVAVEHCPIEPEVVVEGCLAEEGVADEGRLAEPSLTGEGCLAESAGLHERRLEK